MALLDQELPEHATLAQDSSQTRTYSQYLAFALKPEALTRRGPAGVRRGSPTAWLDGLRGVAAFCVMLMHLTVYTHQNIERCYGQEVSGDGKLNDSPLALPIVRAFFLGGHFAVMLFFTISGYVLPRRLIALLHEGQNRRDDFFDVLTSAIFRRAARLFLPVIITTGVIAVWWHISGVRTNFPPHAENIWLEAVSWWNDQLKFVFIFRGGHYLFTYYNGHTWTIPIEFRGSMFIFVWLLAVHLVRTRRRILLTLGMTIYLSCGAAGAWYAAFFAGMLTCELDILAANGMVAQGNRISLPWDRFTAFLKSNATVRSILYHILLLVGLFLASQPASDTQSREKTLDCPTFSTLAKFIPASYYEYELDYRWFWIFWAAWCTLLGIKEIAWVRGLLETSFAQYLGKHSFALYLIHGPMIGMFADRLFYATGVYKPFDEKMQWLYNLYPISNAGPWGLEVNFLCCVAVCVPIFLYVAEIVTRTVDEPSVKIAKWLWVKVRE